MAADRFPGTTCTTPAKSGVFYCSGEYFKELLYLNAPRHTDASSFAAGTIDRTKFGWHWAQATNPLGGLFIDLFCAVGGASSENGLIDNVAVLPLAIFGLRSLHSFSLGHATVRLKIASALVVSDNR